MFTFNEKSNFSKNSINKLVLPDYVYINHRVRSIWQGSSSFKNSLALALLFKHLQTLHYKTSTLLSHRIKLSENRQLLKGLKYWKKAIETMLVL
jgi:hypothetical protein